MNIKKIIASVMATSVVCASMATMSVGAEVQDSYTFSLMGAVGTGQFWDADAPTVEVDGDGSYSLEFEFTEPTESTDGSGAIILSTDINAFDFVEEGTSIDKTEIAQKTGINITIDSVEIDGQEVAYTGPSAGAYVFNDDGSTIRLNVYNVWGNDVKDIDFNFNVEQSIKVNFTVDGLTEAMGNGGDTTTVTSGGDETTVTTKVNIGDSNGSIETTKATTTKKTDSPATSDTGIGAVVALFAVAGASAFVLRKNK